jgi:PTS system ascorbate-specific IIB component
VNGIGTSLIFKSKVEKVCRKLGIEAQVTHAPLGDCKTSAGRYDVVCCSTVLQKNFERLNPEKTKLITVRNLLSEAEIEEEFIKHGVPEMKK